MNHTLTILILLCLGCWSPLAANNIIASGKAGTSLNPVQLFKDSTSDYPTGIAFLGGHLFEILGETANEYEDDSQNQKFKWYHVKAMDGRTGWLYGDGLAVMVATDCVPQELTRFHKQKFSFDNGFENSVAWVAMMEGRDNFHQQDYLNPPYNEQYLVITNSDNRSVHINTGGTNARGKYDLTSLELTDVTGDGISEFILQTNSQNVGENRNNRNLTIFSFQAGSLKKVFEEKMDLPETDDFPSPALFKHVAIGSRTIRVAYPDYIACETYQQPFNTQHTNTKMERCIEYVTYTFQWNERANQFQPLYETSRTPLIAQVRSSGLTLLEKPTFVAKRLAVIPENTPVKVIKHHEKRVRTGRKTQLINYFLVQLDTGEQGYVLADRFEFLYTEHADLLEKFYNHPPVDKSQWQSSQPFVIIESLRDTSMSHK